MKNIFKRIQVKAQQTGEQIIKKSGVSSDFTQTNLKIICKMYLKTLSIAPAYAVQARPKLVTAIQADIKKLLSKGKTREEIIAFYDIPEFKNLWQQLHLTQRDLEVLIDFEIENKENLP